MADRYAKDRPWLRIAVAAATKQQWLRFPVRGMPWASSRQQVPVKPCDGSPKSAFYPPTRHDFPSTIVRRRWRARAFTVISQIAALTLVA